MTGLFERLSLRAIGRPGAPDRVSLALPRRSRFAPAPANWPAGAETDVGEDIGDATPPPGHAGDAAPGFPAPRIERPDASVRTRDDRTVGEARETHRRAPAEPARAAASAVHPAGTLPTNQEVVQEHGSPPPRSPGPGVQLPAANDIELASRAPGPAPAKQPLAIDQGGDSGLSPPREAATPAATPGIPGQRAAALTDMHPDLRRAEPEAPPTPSTIHDAYRSPPGPGEISPALPGPAGGSDPFGTPRPDSDDAGVHVSIGQVTVEFLPPPPQTPSPSGPAVERTRGFDAYARARRGNPR